MMGRHLRVLAAGLATIAAPVPSMAQDAVALRAAMKDLMAKGEFAGIATEVWANGRLVDRSSIGSRDLATKSPMAPDTIVRAFSMTKPITGVALMILHDRGLWDFDDPVSRYLPELAAPKVFRGLDAEGRAILEPARAEPTMGQLVSHTAGYSYGFDPGWVDDQYRAADLWSALSSKDFVDRVARIPLAFQPGTRWHYGVSMDLEGVIVERLTGLTLAEFMKRNIFDPLGMVDTGFYVPSDKLARVATVYEAVGGKLAPARHLILNNDPGRRSGFASGGGGLYTTADDYMKFGRMLLGRGELGGRRILSEAAAATMMSARLSPEILTGGYGVGVQWIRPGYDFGVNGIVVTDPLRAGVRLGVGSYLWDGLASTWFWVDPEHRIVVVGIVQRVGGPDVPRIQSISQKAVAETYYPSPRRSPEKHGRTPPQASRR